MSNILLESAIKYAKRGWAVFPTREVESKPFIVVTKSGEKKTKTMPVKSPYCREGFTEATKNVSIITEWWKKYPEAGIGIFCEASNLVVVDIDVRDGKRGFDNFMKMNIPDEGALHAVTPSGGVHIIYSGLMNSHANVKTGVDIRSKGAYFVAPPSWIYEDGIKKSYIEADDWNKEPVPVPLSLEEELEKLRGKEVRNKEKKASIAPTETFEETISRVRKALDKIPTWVCDDYFTWVNVGMALKTLGEQGFELWDSWSRKSSKYDKDALVYRWDKFEPRDITIATIFYYAKNTSK